MLDDKPADDTETSQQDEKFDEVHGSPHPVPDGERNNSLDGDDGACHALRHPDLIMLTQPCAKPLSLSGVLGVCFGLGLRHATVDLKLLLGCEKTHDFFSTVSVVLLVIVTDDDGPENIFAMMGAAQIAP